MEVRSSERMRKEHITTFTQVFKDSNMEGKVTAGPPVVLRAARRPLTRFVPQYSQMRDELFKSNMVCSFILLVLLMAVQVLIPSPRCPEPPHPENAIVGVQLNNSPCVSSGCVQWPLSSSSASAFTSCSSYSAWGRSSNAARRRFSRSAAGSTKPRAPGRCSRSPPSPSTLGSPPWTS